MRRRRHTLVAGLALVLAAGSAPAGGADGSELQPLDIRDSSVHIALPSDWEVTTGLDYTHFDWGDSAAGYIGVLSAEGTNGSGCELRMYDLSRGGLDDHAEYIAADRRKGGAATEVTSVELDVGEARRIDVQDRDGAYASEYLWHFDPASYLLTCRSPEHQPDDWAEVAASLAWQADSRQAQATGGGPEDVQRLELPDYSVALSLPSAFEPILEPLPYAMSLPPDGAETTPVTTILTANTPDGAACGLEVFEGNPLTLEEHAAWIEEVNLAQPDFEGSVTHTAASLPVGDAVRIDGYDPGDGIWTTMYLFDEGDVRYQLYCLDTQRAADDYLAIAESIELLGAPAEERPEWVPEEAVAWDAVESFVTEVQVSHDETAGWLMGAYCERTVWLEHADGTYEERLDCYLTDEPVEPAELQGTPPTETQFFTGGPCEWYSDYWWLTDGSMRWAESWGMSVEPDGTVLAVGNYGSETLECPEE